MKNISLFLSVLFCFFCISNTQAQNPVWSIPPNYINPNNTPQPLPTGIVTSSHYNGQPAKYCSNAVPDDQGNLLFFSVDGKIYNKNGNFTAKMQENGSAIAGNSELPIVQDPGNSRRYYIFSLNNYVDPNGVDLNASFPCYYSIYCLDAPNSLVPSGSGNLVVNGQAMTQYPALSGGGGGGDRLSTYWAISKLRDANTNPNRFIFINRNSNNVFVVKLDANGLSPQYPNTSTPMNGLVIPLPAGKIAVYGPPQHRSEMEIHEMPNGDYRIALTFMEYDANPNPNSQPERVLSVFEVDHNAQNIIAGSTKNYILPIYGSNDPVIHGLEFSPNGRYLYFTRHFDSQLNPGPQFFIDCFDYNTGSTISLTQIPTTQAEDFQQSQIELAGDGKLYLATSNRLATINDPDNPTTTSFTNNAMGLNNYQISNPVPGNPSTGLYLLPDQIDGQDYVGMATSSPWLQLTDYTAQASGTWTLDQGNNPWSLTNKEVYIADKLVIPAGKTVTIQNMTFHFAPDAKVIIKQGGKLVLDGSTFTNGYVSCNENTPPNYWLGVQVWGTTAQNQSPSGNPTYQGMLVMENEATIEFAHIGAQNWKPFTSGTSGGVIRSENGIFKDNREDVGFVAYQNFATGYPSIHQNDNSVFYTTDFISDDDFIEGLPQQVHVSLYDVHGIHFNGCNFENNVSGTKWNSDAPSRGIYSIDASFSVGISCASTIYPCPTSSSTKSTFSGLLTPIEADGAGSSETVTVSQSVFNNDVNGVLINDIDNVSIDRNTMVVNDVGYNPALLSPIQEIGIKISNSTGYTVEENNVSSPYNPYMFLAPQTYGIIINNSGLPDNRVYKNILNNLRVGTSAYAVNYLNWQYGSLGLKFQCNTYTNNMFDIYVGDVANVADGIAKYQGVFTSGTWKSAGNTFSNPSSLGNSWNINNTNGTAINYYYELNTPNAEPINSNGIYTNITKIVAKQPNTCPSSYGGGIIFQPISFFMAQTDSLQTEYDNVRYNYLSLIDGGDTKQLQQEIDNSWSSDAWTLRNQLMEKSPYLSAKILLNTASKQVLPNAMLLEIILANPDATKDADFINKLNDATHFSFPDYMITYIKNNKDAKTTRTTMENEMSGLQTQIALKQNTIKHRKKMRDSSTLVDRLATVQLGNSISDKMGRMDYYIQQKQWNNAQAVLDSIKNDKKNAKQLQLVDNFGKYIDFRSSLGTRNLAQLDSSEVGYLKTLADNNGRVAGYAKNILCFFYHTCYKDTFPVKADEGSTTETTTADSTLNDVLYKLAISPNPATSSTTISWAIYDGLQNCQYKVQSLKDGSVAAQGSITENEGTVSVNVNTISNGYYVVKIINNGKVKTEKKLVIE